MSDPQYLTLEEAQAGVGKLRVATQYGRGILKSVAIRDDPDGVDTRAECVVALDASQGDVNVPLTAVAREPEDEDVIPDEEPGYSVGGIIRTRKRSVGLLLGMSPVWVAWLEDPDPEAIDVGLTEAEAIGKLVKRLRQGT